LRFAPGAAERAASLGAHREAAAQYARVLRFGDRLEPEERAEFLSLRSTECYLTDENDEAIEAERGALQCYRELGDRRREGDALRSLSQILWCPGRIAESQRAGEDAVAVLEELPPGLELAMAYSNLASLVGDVALSRRALELAERVDDTEIAVNALTSLGVALVGDVPSGLPSVELPDFDLVKDHVATIMVASLALVLIGFSQTAGDARAFAARHRYRIDVDQESVAQGMANAGAGVFQGMPVSTSLSASSLNESAGARTPMASLITGALVVLTLLFLAPLFSDLPKAVLGAVIIDAVVFGMIDVAELRRIWRVARFDFWIAVAAIVGALSSGVLAGVVIGVALSLVWLIRVAATPPIPLLGHERGTQVFRELDEHPGDETFAGVVVLRLDSGLFFATAQALEDRIRTFAEDGSEPVEAVVLDLEGVNFIDSQGAEQLTAIHELLTSHDATLRLARVKPAVLDVLRADGFTELLGADHIHGNVHRAVEAQLRS
jgi:anti-anti-sigma factor